MSAWWRAHVDNVVGHFALCSKCLSRSGACCDKLSAQAVTQPSPRHARTICEFLALAFALGSAWLTLAQLSAARLCFSALGFARLGSALWSDRRFVLADQLSALGSLSALMSALSFAGRCSRLDSLRCSRRCQRCAVVYCDALCCVVLCCVMFCSDVLCCIVFVLCSVVLCCDVLCCDVSCFIVCTRWMTSDFTKAVVA